MSANTPAEVNKVLDEMVAANTQPDGTPAAAPPADPNALLEAAARPSIPEPPPQPQPRPAPRTIDPEKFGQVVNDNAQLREQVQKLTLDLQTLQGQVAKPAQPPQPVQPTPDDGGWGKWSTTRVNEVADATWMADPKEAVRTVLERVGPELATQASQMAYARAWEVGTAMQLDNDFSQLYPDLMRTDMGQIAVRNAIGTVVSDQRFQTLMRNRATRDKALGVVATIAYQALGRTPEVDRALGEHSAPGRKTVHAERAGSRPLGDALNAAPPERQTEAMQSVIDVAASSGIR